MNIIYQETETHFDPQVVHIFSSISKEIYEELARLSPTEIKELVASRVDLFFYNY
jgi:HD-GYP domain-containing protein (c-di-GMP phosphodiesterase class II)